MRRLSLVFPLLFALTATAQDAGTPSPFAGTWKIELDACSDPGPMLEHFDANFIIRRVARSVAPINIITWKGDRFDLQVKAVIMNRKTTIVLDGKTPTADDFVGTPYEYTSVLDGGVVFSKGTITLKDGTTESFEQVRSIEPDGRMVTRMAIAVKAAKPLLVKRVFKRLPAD